jgi:hypothetical protein
VATPARAPTPPPTAASMPASHPPTEIVPMTAPVPAPTKLPLIARTAPTGLSPKSITAARSVRSGRHGLGHLKHVYNGKRSWTY